MRIETKFELGDVVWMVWRRHGIMAGQCMSCGVNRDGAPDANFVVGPLTISEVSGQWGGPKGPSERYGFEGRPHVYYDSEYIYRTEAEAIDASAVIDG